MSEYNKRFCKYCGKELINGNTCECRKNQVSNSRNYYKIGCVVLGVCLVLGFFFAGLEVNSLNTQIAEFQTQIEDNKTVINDLTKDLKENRERMQKTIDEKDIYIHELAAKTNGNLLKAMFLDANVALVTETGKKYHTFDCQYFQNTDYFYVYSVDGAKRLGYTACSVCH